jgi:hypothetical protein
MTLWTGHQCRLERQRLGLSQQALAHLADCPGASGPQICCFEYGGRLREDALRKIEYVLNSIDQIKRVFPFSLDMRDTNSLKAALAAFERRDERWFTEREVKPELPRVITY